MKYERIAVDLAKKVFQVCGVNEHVKPQFNKKLKRKAFFEFMTHQAPTTVVMEACYSSNFWGRILLDMGHTVLLIPAQHVTPFVRGNKNDRNDALAIAEASKRPHIRFVPVKTEYQQEISSLHRIRERLLKQKIAVSNQARGILSEFGVTFNTGKAAFICGMSALVEDEKYSLRLRTMMAELLNEYNQLDKRLDSIKVHLTAFVQNNPYGAILLSIPGIGFIVASALIASIDKGQMFKSPREFAVWLGITPQQYASGNSNRMGGITKRGDRYLRKLLIHGARAVLSHHKNKTDQISLWAGRLLERKCYNKVVVALAHRIARLVWILLQRKTLYVPQMVTETTGE